MNWTFDKDTTANPEALLRQLEVHRAAADHRSGKLLGACAEALRTEIDKSQRLLNAVDTVILGLDPAGRITLINRRGCELLGHKEEDLIGQSWFDSFLPKSPESERVRTVFQRIMAGELAGVEYYENDILTQSGESRTVAWRNNFLTAEDGRVLGTLSVGEDITERLRAEAALRESEARLDHVLTSSPAVIFSYRPGGKSRETTFISENIRDQLGYTPGQCLADPEFWEKNLHPDDRQRVIDNLSLHLGHGKHCDEYRFRHADGGWRWIRDERRVLRDSQGRADEVVGSWSDVTERKAAEQKTATLLRENRRLMQRLFSVQEAERRRLARELHDEFGQWLSAVQANARTVAVLGADRLAEIRESALVIDECVSEVHAGIRRLIRDLRPAVLDELGLEEGLSELVTQWRSHHPHVRCDILVKGPVDDANEALAITLYRVVQEALTNVARHARASRVLIELCRRPADSGAGETLRLRVRDNGVGIEPRTEFSGVGMLGIRERVLAAGGVYQLETAPEQGVTIDIVLPLDKDLPEETEI